MTKLFLLLCLILPLNLHANSNWKFSGAKKALPEVCNAPHPQDWIYPVCGDQEQIFLDAIQKAQKDKKLLVIEFGATWCPWCKALHETLPEVLKQDELKDKFTYLTIATSTTDANKNMQSVDSGKAVLDLVLAKLGKKREATVKGVPFVTIINPDKPNKTVLEDTGDLEKTSADKKYGHDPEKIKSRLLAAWTKLKGQG